MEQTNEAIKSFLFMGIAVMLTLFVSILLIFIFFQRKKYQYRENIQKLHQSQQNQLIEAAVRSEETERHRIAEELHDEVGAILSSSKLHFQGVKLNTADDNNIQLYEKGKELLNEAINQVRGISHNLHSSILKEFGLNAALKNFIEKLAHNSVISATVALDNAYTTPVVDNEISIYRLVQELINNIIKHAAANKIHVSSTWNANALKLTIRHNGNGLTQKQYEELRFQKTGLGLKNIQNRIILLKGDLAFSQKPDGYYIDIYIPKQ